MEIENDREFWVVGKKKFIKSVGCDMKKDKIFKTKADAKKYKLKLGEDLFHVKGLFIIDITYKSGNKMTGAFYKFEFLDDFKNISWISAIEEGCSTPIKIGVDSVESAWIKKRILVYFLNGVEIYREDYKRHICGG